MDAFPRVTESRNGKMPISNEEWERLRQKLCRQILPLISSYNVLCWAKQQQELLNDMTQQTFLNALIYAGRAERGEVPAIQSFEALCMVTARHCLIDRARKDKRLALSDDVSRLHEELGMPVADIAVEHLALLGRIELVVDILMHRIAKKQRVAFLTEVANNANLDAQDPDPWQIALLKYGVHLEEYRHELPTDPVLLSRHRADLCQARKNLLHLALERRRQSGSL